MRWPAARPASAYGPDDLALAEDLAGRAAIAIDNARLYRDIQENDRRKNEFLAMLAHELRNPLAPIRNAVEILRMLAIEDADLQWANDVITRQVEHLVRLVDDLLDISRITGGKIQLRTEPVNVAAAVASAVETSRPLIDARKHELTVTLPPRAGVRGADLVRLAQVLANLLNNAAKYTEEGGRISLEVARVGDEVVFRVSDNGIGISPEMLAQRLRPVHPGRPVARPVPGRPGGRANPGAPTGRNAWGDASRPSATAPTGAASSSSGCRSCRRHRPCSRDSLAPDADSRHSVPRRILLVEDCPAYAARLSMSLRSAAIRCASRGTA